MIYQRKHETFCYFSYKKVIYVVSCVEIVSNSLQIRRPRQNICGTSMGFRWLLGCSQVDCGLRDHFATTVAYLWASCALSVAVVCQMFMPLYIIVVLNLRRFSVFAPKIGDFERKIGANDMRKWLDYNHFRMGVFFLKKLFVCRRLCRRFCFAYRNLLFYGFAFNKFVLLLKFI